jgi:exodeoxyribonuclease VII small subunit
LTAGRVGGENGVMSKKALKFEEALARLEGIADEIEQGKIGLEESIARYEEGMKLVQRCQIDSRPGRTADHPPASRARASRYGIGSGWP